ncbi:MAG: adenylyl cyclase, partial [Gammaproteobacteria bacterium]|nr:adenylyl cyclase [Gammaproteobacteria bacterium]
MSLIDELKRRNVFKVAIAYLVASWLILQMTEVLTELLALQQDVGKLVILFLIIGFIPAVIFAWAFEMTPEGIKKEKDVVRDDSITHQTGRKLDFTIIAGLVVIAGYFIWEARFAEKSSDLMPQENAAQIVASLDEKTDPAPVDAPAKPNDNSIAVLPFANRSNVDGDLFFTDGIHDDLLTQLAKIDNLKVISRTSVMEYRDTTKKISEIASELGV